MAFCSKCGTEINDSAKFCPKCGQTVGNGAHVSQQRVNQSQQQYDESKEERLNIWMRLLIILFWPIGIIMGIIYKKKMKVLKARDAFIWSVAGIGAAVGVYLSNNLNGCSSTTRRIETTTKNLMIQKFKEDGSTLFVKDLTLVHKSGNEYTGIAECQVNGVNAQYSIKVLYDGTNVQAEWELSDIGNDSSEETEDEEEISNVPSSVSNDVAEEGYNDGYQMGFQVADIDMKPDAKISFTTTYGAPSTPEEKEMYNIYKQNYERGFRDGKRAGRE